MKHLIAIAAMVIVGFTQGAQAQNLTGQASANSGSQSGALAQAGNNLTINSAPIPTDTETKLKAAPGLGGLALGSGHPCAYSPSSAQFSIIGGGAGYGAMKVDSACMLLLQSVAAGDKRAYNAAMYMIAARDKEACKAMAAAGMIQCGDEGVTNQAVSSKVSTKNRVPAEAPALYSKCALEGNQIKIKYTAAGRKNKPVAAAACQRQLGY